MNTVKKNSIYSNYTLSGHTINDDWLGYICIVDDDVEGYVTVGKES